MGTRYPDQVGGDKPCGPVVVMVPCPCLGLFIGHDGGSFAFGRLGHPGLSLVGILVGVAAGVSWE